MKRQSGILLHISSLPNRYGIGTFGQECYDFIDFLAQSGQKVWEILPLGQTGFGDSPYSSVCSYSYNPYFISLDVLCGEGLLKKSEISELQDETPFVDFGKLYYTRYAVLRKAYDRFDKTNENFVKFVKSKKYRDYALYMSIKGKQDSKAFYDWAKEYKYRDKSALIRFEKDNDNEIKFWLFLQFKASEQWKQVRAYAKEKGIMIMGDLPLYVAYDSVDVWANPQYFKLDENLTPKKVAGVPPDYFSATGQLWGNPVYDYASIKADGYAWWKNRFKSVANDCDLIRIDHFRGMDRFYQIDYGRDSAVVGEWESVDGRTLLDSVHSVVNKSRIIAEDLGIIDDGVKNLLAYAQYPGMRILSFAFNGDENNTYLPQNVEENSVCYTGTHDNDTLIGLIENFTEWDYANFVRGVENSCARLGVKAKMKDNRSIAKTVIELGFASKAKLFILPMQDVALLNGDYRMNTPGREIANWTTKIAKKHFNATNAKNLKALSQKYNR